VTHPPGSGDLVAQPAARAVRVLALAHLEQIRAGHARFIAGDAEGLHDLRVAMRRLRTLLRAYRPFVTDTVKRNTRRTLSRLARATGAARDAEVAVEWVRAQRELPPRSRAGYTYVLEMLEQERDAAARKLRTRLERDLPGLLRLLARQLTVYHDELAVGAAPPIDSMAIAAAGALRSNAERLSRRADRLDSRFDATRAHRVRIAGKRLRYVIDSWKEYGLAAEAGAQLTDLQDTLGALHDAHQFVNRFVRDVGEQAARDARRHALRAAGVAHDVKSLPFARLRPGLVELIRRAHARERSVFRAYRRRWNPDAIEDLTAKACALADAFESGNDPAPGPTQAYLPQGP